MPRKFGFSNEYTIEGNITKFIIINKKEEKFEVLIDTEDLPKLIKADLKWNATYDKSTNEYYVKAIKFFPQTLEHNFYEKTIFLHRFIMNASKGVVIDHHNHNRLDNRKENLFITEHSNNSSNRKGANKNNKTGVRNVNLVTRNGKQMYYVQLMKKGVSYKWEFELDQFEEACKFAELKRQEIFGEFAGRG